MFATLAKRLINEEKIFFGEVQILGYGSPQNDDLAQRFQLNQGMLPELILFTRKKLPGKKLDHVASRYGGEMTLRSLESFLKTKTGLWITLPGCNKDLDELAGMFMRNSGKDREKIIQQTKDMVEDLKANDPQAHKYLNIMNQINDKGKDFAEQEKKRLKKLLESSSLSVSKSQDLEKTLNILQSFHSTKGTIKDEL